MCSYFIFKIDHYKLHERLPSLYLVLLKKYLHQQYYIPRNKFPVYLLLQIPSFTVRALPLLKRCKRCAPCTWWRSIFPVEAMKTYRGSRGIAPHILNLSIRWRWVHDPGWGLGTPHGRFGKEKIFLPLPEFKPQTVRFVRSPYRLHHRALWCRVYKFFFISNVLTRKLGKNVKLIVFFVHFLFQLNMTQRASTNCILHDWQYHLQTSPFLHSDRVAQTSYLS
jgi:hypothetical protein